MRGKQVLGALGHTPDVILPEMPALPRGKVTLDEYKLPDGCFWAIREGHNLTRIEDNLVDASLLCIAFIVSQHHVFIYENMSSKWYWRYVGCKAPHKHWQA